MSPEEGMRRMIRFAFTDDDGDLDLGALPEFKAAIDKAEQRGAERERAAVVAWLRRGLSFDARAEAIEAGKHREEE